jgi:flagellar biosynthesis protein FlhG
MNEAHDQAKRLRELVQEAAGMGNMHNGKEAMTARVIAVASGKGGVGKSNFSVNLAVQMRKLDKRVVIIDADFGLANVEILFGIPPMNTVSDVLNGKMDIEDALTVGPMGVLFLSGGTGMNALGDLNESQVARLVDGFLKLDTMTDFIIIDTRAGVNRTVLNMIKAATETIIITTPDPTAIADAYALIKSIKTQGTGISSIKLVVNCCGTKTEASDVFEKLNGVSTRFLGINLAFLGYVPTDPQLVKAVRSQRPVSMMYPNADSSERFRYIALDFLEMESEKRNSIQQFVLKMLGKFRDTNPKPGDVACILNNLEAAAE